MCLINKGPPSQEYLYFPYDMGLIFPYSSILHPCSSTSPFVPVQKTPQGNPYASKCKHCKCALHQPGVSLAIWKMGVTLTETIIGPENSCLAEYFPLAAWPILRDYVSFWEGTKDNICEKCEKSKIDKQLLVYYIVFFQERSLLNQFWSRDMSFDPGAFRLGIWDRSLSWKRFLSMTHGETHTYTQPKNTVIMLLFSK